MATATQARTRRDPPKTQDETLLETQDEALEGTLFDEVESDAYVNVYRLNETTKRWDFQFRLSPDELDPNVIQELRGGGKYKLQERVPAETGGYVFGRQRTMTIDGPVKPLTMLPKSQVAGTVPGADSAAPTTVGAANILPGGVGMSEVMTAGLMQVFEGMGRASEMQSAALAQMMNRPQTDWGPILVAVVPLITQMMERPDGLGQMEKIANILSVNQKGAGGLTETIEAVVAIRDLMTPPGEGSGDPIVDLATKNLPALIELMKSGTAAGQSPEQIRAEAQKQLTTGAPTENVPAQPAPGDKPLWQQLLEHWGPRLVDQAKKDVDPESSAKVTLGNMPDHLRGTLREFLEKPDSQTILFQSVPGLLEYKNWAEDFFNTLVLEFDPNAFDDAEGDDSTETELIDGQDKKGDEREAGKDGSGDPVLQELSGSVSGGDRPPVVDTSPQHTETVD